MKLLVFAADAQSGAFSGRKAVRAIHNGIWARTLAAVEACRQFFCLSRNKPEIRPDHVSDTVIIGPDVGVACLECYGGISDQWCLDSGRVFDINRCLKPAMQKRIRMDNTAEEIS